MRTPLRRLTVDIAPGDAAVLNLGTGAHAVADRVVLWNGKPAQGAEVHLFRTEDRDRDDRRPPGGVKSNRPPAPTFL